jgi:membrane protein
MRLGRFQPVDTGKQLVQQVIEDDVSGLAAELAYRFFLALFPFFIFLAALGGFVAFLFDVPNPTQQIVQLLGETLPPTAAELVRGQLEAMVGTRHPGLLSIGILGAIWVATGGTNALIKAMNRAYDVGETRPFWKKYLLAIGLTLLAGSVLIGAFVLFVVGEIYGRQLAAAMGLTGAFETALGLGRWVAIAALLLLAAVVLYRAAPNMDLELKWITPGAIVFVVGWLVATYLFALYVANFGSYNATYGTLAGVAVLLVWFYLIAFILLVGAELNAILDRRMDPDAVDERRRRVHEQAAHQRVGATDLPRG